MQVQGLINQFHSEQARPWQELPADAAIVVVCHHGMRSLQVAQFLKQAGLAQVYNLSGGIAAWAAQVDPDMPQY